MNLGSVEFCTHGIFEFPCLLQGRLGAQQIALHCKDRFGLSVMPAQILILG